MVVERREVAGAVHPLLGFETQTLASIDRTLICRGQLTDAEADCIDSYHAIGWTD